jgi:hypothetical protein
MRAIALSVFLFASPAIAGDQDQSPVMQKCSAIQEIIEAHPEVEFTQMTSVQVAMWLKAAPHKDVASAWYVPYPPDHNLMVVHVFDAKGCWINSAQMPKTLFEKVMGMEGI